MNDTLEKDQVRRLVQERYGAIAQRNSRGCGCGPREGVLESGTDPEKLGYNSFDVVSVPHGAEMGLGCGNPTELASIKAGESILDLGCGGGFDCFLAAKAIGGTGKIICVEMTPRHDFQGTRERC